MFTRRSLAAILAAAPAAQFIMLERQDCPFCRRWHREVGARAWNASDLGARAPLRLVDVARGLPDDLSWITEGRVVPTFLLARDQREIGRFLGYNGSLFFWQQAEALVARL